MILAELERVLTKHKVARSGESRVVVACSGGCDSVALAHASATVLGGRRVVLAHIDHGVRPTSTIDARAAAELAHTLGLRHESVVLASERDDEATLRDLRYAALEKIRRATDAVWVLTAHHESDQAETILLRLIRGGGPAALSGIPEARGAILRPWLQVSRAAIRDYAARHRLAFVEDPTNAEPRYLRNRVRKELLPLLERRYRAGVTRRLAGLARAASEGRNDGAPPAPNRAASQAVEVFERPEIVVQRRAYHGEDLPSDANTAWFDAAELPSVTVRTPRAGDRIQPMGMSGSKKLQDVFVDAKIPRSARSAYPVLADASGVVLWVPGLVRGACAPVGPRTREVWVFRREA